MTILVLCWLLANFEDSNKSIMLVERKAKNFLSSKGIDFSEWFAEGL